MNRPAGAGKERNRRGARARAFAALCVDRVIGQGRSLDQAFAETLNEEVGHIDPEAIRARIDSSIEPLQALSKATFSRWIDRFDLGARRHHLPSR